MSSMLNWWDMFRSDGNPVASTQGPHIAMMICLDATWTIYGKRLVNTKQQPAASNPADPPNTIIKLLDSHFMGRLLVPVSSSDTVVQSKIQQKVKIAELVQTCRRSGALKGSN